MFFLNLWYLWFLPLAAIPVLLNLWKRKRVKEILFPYFDLLMESNITNLTPLKILNFLLLILRILFICGLIFFMARPFLFGSESLASLPSKDIPIVFVLDNSKSMVYTHERMSLFGRSSQLIEDSVKSLDINTPCALVYMNEQGDIDIEESFANPERLLTKLRSIEPLNYTFKIQDALEKSEQFFVSLGKTLKKSPKKIIVLSDNQRINWADCDNLKLDESIKIYFYLPESIDFKGVGWVGYRFPERLVKKGENSFVAGILSNFGKDKIQGLTVRFFIDGHLVDESLISLEPGEMKEKKFYYSINDTEISHRTVLSVESPDFQLDNELKLVLPVYPDPEVVLISGADEEVYLSSALTLYFKGNEKSYSYLNLNSVKAVDLLEKDIIILVTGENEQPVLDALKNVVAKGANAIVFRTFENSEPDAFSSVISYANFKHPVLEPYSIMGIKGMESLQIFSSLKERFLQELPYREILLSSIKGSVFMEEITLGKGKIIVFYTDPQALTSNFANTSLFLPFMHRIMDYFVKNSYSITANPNKLFSEKLFLADDHDFSVEWITPEGETHVYKTIFINGEYKTGSFIATSEGYYTLVVQDGSEHTVSYIIPFYEGDLTGLSKDDTVKKLPDNKIFFSDMFYSSAGTSVGGKIETSKMLLILCLVVSLIELAVANLCS